jgi:hypothetical protein
VIVEVEEEDYIYSEDGVSKPLRNTDNYQSTRHHVTEDLNVQITCVPIKCSGRYFDPLQDDMGNVP